MTRKPSGPSRRAALLGAAGIGAAGALATQAGAAADERFDGRIGLTRSSSQPGTLHKPPSPRPGAPNIVVILLDDVGFADLDCYGGEIGTPEIDGLAANGLRYVNFRTTGVCAATRASLLTGLNPHSAGIAWLPEFDGGYPGYRGDLTHRAATLPEALGAQGYSTYHCGKWHVNAAESSTAIGPMQNWPLQRGFDRAYWFHGHSTDFFNPASFYDGNEPAPAPGPTYYATDDLTDRAIRFVREHRAQAPERPFFLYLAHPGAHSPLHARPEDLQAVRGRYAEGWDTIRARRLARQKQLGLIPADTELPALNPGVKAWSDLSADEQRLHGRYMEAYAAVIRRIDWNIGRLKAALGELDALDNTIVVIASDNGGSPDGGLSGTTNLFAGVNGGVSVAEALKQFDAIGGPDTYPMYPMGWATASNTPFRLYKHDTHLGGVADPLVIHWPKGVGARGEVRGQFVHVMDLYPTLLDCAGVRPPTVQDGQKLKPLQGVSFRASLGDGAAPETRREQHFEMNGQRAMYADGWRLVSTRPFADPQDRWELFDLSREINERTDLSAARPDMVKALEAKWLKAAARYDVLPIDTRSYRLKSFVEFFEGGGRGEWDLVAPLNPLLDQASPAFFGRDHRIDVEIAPFDGRAEGVLVAYGNQFLGFVLYVQAGRLVYEAVSRPVAFRASAPLPSGARRIGFTQTLTARPWTGEGVLSIDERPVARLPFERALFGRPMQGLQIGGNDAGPVSHAYAQPFRYGDGLQRVRIRLDTTPYSAAEIAAFEEGLKRRRA